MPRAPFSDVVGFRLLRKRRIKDWPTPVTMIGAIRLKIGKVLCQLFVMFFLRCFGSLAVEESHFTEANYQRPKP